MFFFIRITRRHRQPFPIIRRGCIQSADQRRDRLSVQELQACFPSQRGFVLADIRICTCHVCAAQQAADSSYASQGEDGIAVLAVYVLDIIINAVICLIIWKKVGKSLDFEEMRENW